jgi:phosphoserine phosphatase RsbU/P
MRVSWKRRRLSPNWKSWVFDSATIRNFRNAGAHIQGKTMLLEISPPDPKQTKVSRGTSLRDLNTFENSARNANPADVMRMQTCIALGKVIQQDLLPSEAPRISGLDINGKCIYSGSLGGDYFDFMDFGGVCCSGPEHMAIAVGDVSGHGVGPALLMATIRAYIRSRVTQPGDLDQVISDVNRLISRDVADAGHFMTLFFMDIHRQKKEISWVRAGHDPAFFFDSASRRFELLAGSGIALGVDSEHLYTMNRRCDLKEGDIIVIGTDGIWETRDTDGGYFGKQRLKALIEQHADDTSSEIVNHVLAAIADFRKGRPQEDDVSLVVIKVIA